MKKGLVVCVIVIILIILGFIEQNYIDSTFEKLNNRALDLRSSLMQTSGQINVPANFTKISETKNFWEDREDILCLFLNHQHMEEVHSLLTELKNSIAFNDTQQAIEEIELVLNFVYSYSHLAKVNVQNII